MICCKKINQGRTQPFESHSTRCRQSRQHSPTSLLATPTRHTRYCRHFWHLPRAILDTVVTSSTSRAPSSILSSILAPAARDPRYSRHFWRLPARHPRYCRHFWYLPRVILDTVVTSGTCRARSSILSSILAPAARDPRYCRHFGRLPRAILDTLVTSGT